MHCIPLGVSVYVCVREGTVIPFTILAFRDNFWRTACGYIRRETNASEMMREHKNHGSTGKTNRIQALEAHEITVPEAARPFH